MRRSGVGTGTCHGIAGTADDRVLATLRQLDDIPFVGTVTFHKLLAYARRQPLLE